MKTVDEYTEEDAVRPMEKRKWNCSRVHFLALVERRANG